MFDYTKFEDIYRLFLGSIQDYRLRNLFKDDIPTAEDVLETYLLKAIPKFRNCKQCITNIDEIQKCFKVSLTLDEKMILTDLMLLSWMEQVCNNIAQMDLTLNDNDFKHYSEEKNLREKVNSADIIREKVSQSMVDYGLYNTPFKEWADGNYGL